MKKYASVIDVTIRIIEVLCAIIGTYFSVVK